MHLLLSFPHDLAAETEFLAFPLLAEATTAAATEPEPTDDDDDDVSTAGVVLQLAIFILIPVAMYFLLIRPRRRMMREQQAVQRSVEVGDEVLLTSGMYGFVTGFEEGTDVVWVEVDEDVQVRVTRAGISGKVSPSVAGDAGSPEPTGRPTLKGGSKADAGESAERAEPVEE